MAAVVMYRRIHIERTRMAKRLGRRGLLLILIGAAWLSSGIIGFLYPNERFSSPGAGRDTLLQFMDDVGGPVLGVVLGGIGLVAGVMHKRPKQNALGTLGWNAVLSYPYVVSCLFAWSFISSLLTDGEQGRPRGVTGLIVWVVVSGIIMIVAGWPEESHEELPSFAEE